MIEDPGWTAGNWISAMPARGPMLNSRRSDATLPTSTASRRSAPENAKHVPHALRDAEAIGGRPQRHAGVRRQVRDGEPRVVVTRVEARSDGRRTEVQLVQLLRGPLDILRCVRDVRGVAIELLAQRDRYRVLQMRPSRFEDVRRTRALWPRVRRRARARRPRAQGPSRARARRVAVGYTSLVDCPMLT